MNLKLPARINLLWTVAASLLLFLAQIFLGTGLLFALGVFLFINVSMLTVNLLGGLKTLTGLIVFVIAAKFVLISQIAKTFKFQNADSFLDSPESTIGVLLLSMIATLCAAAVTRPFVPTTPVFRPVISVHKLRSLTWFFLIFCGGAYAYLKMFGFNLTTGEIEVGGIFGVLRFLTRFNILTVATATAGVIIASNGKRSIDLLSIIAISFNFFIGVISTSKYGMISPFVIYGITCFAFRYRIKMVHIFSGMLVIFLSFQLIFPFAQHLKGQTGGFSAAKVIEFTTNEFVSMITSPDKRKSVSSYVYNSGADRSWTLYYGEPLPYIDRFSLIKQADLLITATDSYGTLGFTTISYGLSMILPRFINPDKPVHGIYNLLGHHVGQLNPNDSSTQVTYGLAADSYSSFGWGGAFVIPFVLMSVFFLVYNALAGQIEYNVWSIFFALRFQHSMVETSISSLIIELTTNAVVLYMLYLIYVFISNIFSSGVESRQTYL